MGWVGGVVPSLYRVRWSSHRSGRVAVQPVARVTDDRLPGVSHVPRTYPGVRPTRVPRPSRPLTVRFLRRTPCLWSFDPTGDYPVLRGGVLHQTCGSHSGPAPPSNVSGSWVLFRTVFPTSCHGGLGGTGPSGLTCRGVSRRPSPPPSLATLGDPGGGVRWVPKGGGEWRTSDRGTFRRTRVGPSRDLSPSVYTHGVRVLVGGWVSGVS